MARRSRIVDKDKLGYFENIGPDGKPTTSGTSSVGARPNQKSMNTSIRYSRSCSTSACIRSRQNLACEKAHAGDAGHLPRQDLFRARLSHAIPHHRLAEEPLMPRLIRARCRGGISIGRGRRGFRPWRRSPKLDGRAASSRPCHAIWLGQAIAAACMTSGRIDVNGVGRTGNLATNKIWWVQAEHLNALLLQHDRRRQSRTGVNTRGCIRQAMELDQDLPNRPRQRRLVADGSSQRNPRQPREGRHVGPSECYHQARAMMNVSDRLRKLAANGK